MSSDEESATSNGNPFDSDDEDDEDGGSGVRDPVRKAGLPANYTLEMVLHRLEQLRVETLDTGDVRTSQAITLAHKKRLWLIGILVIAAAKFIHDEFKKECAKITQRH